MKHLGDKEEIKRKKSVKTRTLGWQIFGMCRLKTQIESRILYWKIKEFRYYWDTEIPW